MELVLVDEEIKDRAIEVKEGESLMLNLAAFKSFPSAKIDIRVARNASVKGVFADFSKGEGHFVLNVYLDGEGSSCDWHLAALSDGSSRKVFDTSVWHNVGNTTGVMSNYGICRDESRLTFTGVSEIKRGSKGSSTQQSAKIIVFDPLCDGKCSPILNIDENDVSASHAAVVGKLNENHLFYLMSRGLSREEARRLITLGYMKPIEAYFADDSLKKRIDDAIEGGI
ncbi:MAG: SufD family Fe-S cluster assembly protein [Bacilli bacterium]|nr:SufD family Fe-S cluster assembly protein [Bacilli bacterium]